MQKINKIKHLLITNILSKLGIKGIFFNFKRVSKKNYAANIQLNSKRLHIFYLKLGTMQSFLFNIVLKFLANAIRQGKKGTMIGEVALYSLMT